MIEWGFRHGGGRKVHKSYKKMQRWIGIPHYATNLLLISMDFWLILIYFADMPGTIDNVNREKYIEIKYIDYHWNSIPLTLNVRGPS